ncbi:MAG: guanylate kinase [Zoogloeaceae bacterium]|jgi:guanylate kinase|nr:guanylate kinase [Zoogloeaceae bacterium]
MSGLLFIVTAPSGAGKTTLVRQLRAGMPEVRLSVSHTTRAPRVGEVDGQAYHFVDVDTFKAMIAAGDFLEWAEVHGNLYGTSRRWIETERAAGRDVLLEIDWQGATQVRALWPEAIGIFILPPSMDTLAAQLKGRGTEREECVARRLATAREEMRHVDAFDYVIINDDLQTATADFAAVVRASRLTLPVQRAREAVLFARLTQ